MELMDMSCGTGSARYCRSSGHLDRDNTQIICAPLCVCLGFAIGSISIVCASRNLQSSRIAAHPFCLPKFNFYYLRSGRINWLGGCLLLLRRQGTGGWCVVHIEEPVHGTTFSVPLLLVLNLNAPNKWPNLQFRDGAQDEAAGLSRRKLKLGTCGGVGLACRLPYWAWIIAENDSHDCGLNRKCK